MLFSVYCVSSSLRLLGETTRLSIDCIVQVSQRNDEVSKLIHRIVVLRLHIPDIVQTLTVFWIFLILV